MPNQTYSQNSPERLSAQERLQVRSRLVEDTALNTGALLYAEFGVYWSNETSKTASTSQASLAARPLVGTGGVIDRTFLEAQHSEIVQDQAVTEAQRRVMEAFDELAA